ncbi:uncharacterized protein LOC141602677 [Silene latifolia]|uniref:uncharacterized protein LOC141602677 n=1 Tax=Silene latifolia TaxID=37657 RepID=UPI003D77BAE4
MVMDQNPEHTASTASKCDVIEIEPGKLWFDDTQVTRRVTRSFKNNYDFPYFNWSETPQSKKDAWFNGFRSLCKWDSRYDEECRIRYDETAQKRLKGSVNEAARSKANPGWMLPHVHKAFLEKRKGKGFVKKSEQASLNKRGGEDGPTTHHYGSIKAVKHAAKMAKDREGKIPNAVELFLDTHRKMIDGKEVWSHPKAKKKYEDYLTRVRDHESRGEPVDPNAIWFDLNNGFVKGAIFGLGTAAPLYYTQTPSTSKKGKSSASQTYIPGVLTQAMEAREREADEFRKFREESMQREELILKSQEELKQQQLKSQEELKQQQLKSQEENLRSQEEMRRQIETLTKMFQSQTQYHCNTNFLNTPHNPNDDNSGGGGIGGAGVGYQVS